jgi:hypothetical protein
VLVYACLVHGQYSDVAFYFAIRSSIRSADDPGSRTFFLPRLRKGGAAETFLGLALSNSFISTSLGQIPDGFASRAPQNTGTG